MGDHSSGLGKGVCWLADSFVNSAVSPSSSGTGGGRSGFRGGGRIEAYSLDDSNGDSSCCPASTESGRLIKAVRFRDGPCSLGRIGTGPAGNSGMGAGSAGSSGILYESGGSSGYGAGLNGSSGTGGISSESSAGNGG